MATTKNKTHTLIVRGVSKSQKNALKRIANDNKRSVNFAVLQAIDILIGNDATARKELTFSKNPE